MANFSHAMELLIRSTTIENDDIYILYEKPGQAWEGIERLTSSAVQENQKT